MIALRVGGSQDVHETHPERYLGTDLTEAAIGTNGNGTCLVEERPVAVSGLDHFRATLTPTVCIAAPIFAPDGGMLGCLNILTQASHPNARLLRPLAQSAVRWCAGRIEIALFAEAFSACRIMLAPGANGNVGALLSIDREGVVVGATRAARRLLALDPDALEAGVEVTTLERDGVRDNLADLELKTIASTLARHAGNKSRAARALGIGRATLSRKLAQKPQVTSIS